MTSSDAIVAEIPRLRRYARALTGDPARADDLVQDTLERALGRFFLFRPGNLRAWLFSIMHNLFINQAKARRDGAWEDEAVLAELPARATQDDALEVRDLARCLQALPPEQREVLLLVGLEEMSYEEAARVLGVPLGTVMSRLFRARERLRGLLAGLPAQARLKVVK
ncbi:MAG: sigma-70 family RNA polymerase sigma factor [Pseudomonadota bacterium]|jgi:RNA polymerase sigma-70 factor (ECF subfamily)